VPGVRGGGSEYF
jgi:hypothetical protein